MRNLSSGGQLHLKQHALAPSAFWLAGHRGVTLHDLGPRRAHLLHNPAHNNKLVSSVHGNIVNFDGTNRIVGPVVPNAALGIRSNKVTIAAKVKIVGTPTNGVVFGRPAGATHVSPFFDFSLFYHDSVQWNLRFTNSSGSTGARVLDFTPDAEGFATAFGSWEGSVVGMSLWDQTGASSIGAVLGGSALADSGQPISFGGNVANNERLTGGILWAAVWPFNLSIAQGLWFEKNWESLLVERPRARKPVPIAPSAQFPPFVQHPVRTHLVM